jgi:hypothetical protein
MGQSDPDKHHSPHRIEFQPAAVFSKPLRTFWFFLLLFPPRVYARKYETGFIDRTITIQAVNFKYQVFVPEDWTPHQKWPVILALHGAGERGAPRATVAASPARRLRKC